MNTRNDVLTMAQAFCAAEEKVSAERGGFCLFGLFERERTPGRWDLVVSAPWLKTDRDATLEIIVLLRDHMETRDWQMVATVLPLEHTAAYVEWITSNYRMEHQVEEVFGTDFSNVHLGHAILITSNPSPSPARVMPQPVAA